MRLVPTVGLKEILIYQCLSSLYWQYLSKIKITLFRASDIPVSYASLHEFTQKDIQSRGLDKNLIHNSYSQSILAQDFGGVCSSRCR